MRHIYSLAQQAPRQTYTPCPADESGRMPLRRKQLVSFTSIRSAGAAIQIFKRTASGTENWSSCDPKEGGFFCALPSYPLTFLFFFVFVRSAGARGLRSRGAACGRNSRGGAGANTATASCGRNRELCLAQCSNFYKGIHARRKNWLSTRGQRSAFCEGAATPEAKTGHRNPEQGGAALLRFAVMPLNTLFLFLFVRSAGARGPGRGFRLPLPNDQSSCA